MLGRHAKVIEYYESAIAKLLRIAADIPALPDKDQAGTGSAGRMATIGGYDFYSYVAAFPWKMFLQFLSGLL